MFHLLSDLQPKSLLNIPNFFNNILDQNKEDYVVDPVMRLIEIYG